MNKKVLILVNHDLVIYNFRKELVQKLIDLNYNVVISSPKGNRLNRLEEMGAKITLTDIDRHGHNPFQEFNLLKKYYSLIKKENPDVILSYTIKPNIYGSLAARLLKKPLIANITGLGNAINNDKNNSKLLIYLYKISLRKVNHIFFQNRFNQNYLVNKIKLKNNYSLLPGSGVNLEEFTFEEYQEIKEHNINILYFGRLMESKGIIDLLEAIKLLNNEYIKFQFVGFFDDKLVEDKFYEYQKDCNIEIIEHQENMKPYITKAHAVIMPSHHEGMSNALLEAAAMGRPLLASNIPGCQEIIENGVNGFLFEAKNSDSIASNIKKFAQLSYQDKVKMGIESRKKVMKEFDRNIVVKEYLDKIVGITGGNL